MRMDSSPLLLTRLGERGLLACVALNERWIDLEEDGNRKSVRRMTR